MILQDVITVLEADSDVNDLIDGRIFTDVAPDNSTTPYIVQTLLIGERQSILEPGRTTVNPARMQIDCYSPVLATAIDLSEKVEVALYATNVFRVADFSTQSDYDADLDMRRIIIDCSIWSI